MMTFPTSGDITIEINGKPLAVAQSYRVKSARDSKTVEAFGQKEPVGTVAGKCLHQLELQRVEVLDGLGDEIDFYGLSGFNVVIAKPGRRMIYTGCEWAAITEAASLGSVVLESVSIVATKRMVLQ